MYSHTEPPPDERLPWHRRPSIVGVLGLAGTFALNLVFFWWTSTSA